MPHQTGFLLLPDEMDGEEEVEVEVDLVDGLHVHLELVHGGCPEGDDRVAEAAEDGGGGRGGSLLWDLPSLLPPCLTFSL